MLLVKYIAKKNSFLHFIRKTVRELRFANNKLGKLMCNILLHISRRTFFFRNTLYVDEDVASKVKVAR